MRLFLLSLLVACSGPAPTYQADLRPILEARCTGCHRDGGIGPVRLESYDQLVAVAERVVDNVESRTMPPWKATPTDVAYQGDPSLSDAQIALFRTWIDGGMREGDPTDPGPPIDPVSVSLPRVDTTLASSVPYRPAADLPDDYRCFIVDWPGTGMEFVTGFEVQPDNKSVVHHVAAFLVRPDGLVGPGALDTFRGFDEAEAGPGYTCFGGPSGAEQTQVPIQQIAQWVPGSGAVLFPTDVGIAVPEGSLVVLQVHYNLASWDGEPDQTSVQLITEDRVARLGAFAPFLDPLWPLGNMPIPAGQQSTHSKQGDPIPFFELLNGELDLSAGFEIHAAMLHMHNLGRSGSIAVERADGSSLELLRVEDWDFNWQLSYRFEQPVGFEPGDALSLSCSFDNDRAEDANWGEGSDQEMCVGNLFISQR